MNRTVDSYICRDASDKIIGIVWGPREWCERLPYLATRIYRNDLGQLTNEDCSFATRKEAIAYSQTGAC